MENFETLRINILVDVIPTFFMGVRDSKCNEEIRVSARKMLDSLIESVFPGQEMTIKAIETIPKESKMDKAPSPVGKSKIAAPKMSTRTQATRDV